ncbi:LPXTG cell wall anchor domain-containing protein [Dactylosporangium sp. NPDC000521]|uniref:LPXTG cell wall anchor domain-containing protein n=1 Tax=Dactylosporangium sp. NPDC000521 TaxID=3363975 RepID=UPI0036A57E0B
MISAHPLRRLLLSTAALAAAGIASAGIVAPSPAMAASLPDLQVKIAVAPVKATYAVGDTITTTFIVVNVGAATAKNARIEGGNEEGIDRKTDEPSDQFDLAPGASRSFAWAGTVGEAAAVQGFATGAWAFTNDAGEANPDDNTGRFRIEVPGSTGVLSGKVYVDVKGDFDSDQPGLAGVALTVADAKGKTAGTTKTGADGAFTMTLPAGVYVLSVAGWKVEGENSANAQVLGGQTASIALPLVPGGSQPGPTRTATPAPSSPAPGLPVTGSQTGRTLLVGAAVIVIGAAAFVVGRRRRRRFVLPD